MIARHWRGLCRSDLADRYEAHLRGETIPELSRIDGFRGASILRRVTDGGTEFLVITSWDSIEAIRRFAGPDVTAAVVPPAVQEWMVEYDRHARHYDLVGKDFDGLSVRRMSD